MHIFRKPEVGRLGSPEDIWTQQYPPLEFLALKELRPEILLSGRTQDNNKGSSGGDHGYNGSRHNQKGKHKVAPEQLEEEERQRKHQHREQRLQEIQDQLDTPVLMTSACPGGGVPRKVPEAIPDIALGDEASWDTFDGVPPRYSARLAARPNRHSDEDILVCEVSSFISEGYLGDLELLSKSSHQCKPLDTRQDRTMCSPTINICDSPSRAVTLSNLDDDTLSVDEEADRKLAGDSEESEPEETEVEERETKEEDIEMTIPQYSPEL
ncbi:hypothetical protein FB451DRAFT_1376070 [Mycena latifolia]|nr:hypothetical protein FB451DRAFT_1376070 [Mycena latifolia]